MSTLLPISEFSNCNNPMISRMAFYLSDAVDDVSEEWRVRLWATPYSGDGVALLHTGREAYMLLEDGVVRKVVKTTHTETGGVTWNGDDEYYKEIKTEYVLGDEIGVVDNFLGGCDTLEGIENIACQIAGIIYP